MAKEKKGSFAGQSEFAELRELVKVDEPERDLEWEYRVGELTNELVPRGDRQYGQGRINALVEALQQEVIFKSLKSKLWNARKLVDAISRTELRQLQAKAQAAGYNLRISHLNSFMGLTEEKQRKKMAQKCFKEKWSVVKLRRQIQKAKGGKKSFGGLPPKRPATAEDALHEIQDQSSEWLNRYQRTWFLDKKATLQGDLASATIEELADEIKETEDGLLKLRNAADAARRRLREIRLGTAGRTKGGTTRKKKPSRRRNT